MQFLFDNSGGAMKLFKKIAQQSNEDPGGARQFF